MHCKKHHKKNGCFFHRVRNRLWGRDEEHGEQPLSSACQGGRVRICKVTGDRKLCARMAAMGVLPGHELELICPANGERCLVKINGGTLSLDDSTSQNILVTSVR